MMSERLPGARPRCGADAWTPGLGLRRGCLDSGLRLTEGLGGTGLVCVCGARPSQLPSLFDSQPAVPLSEPTGSRGIRA